MRDIESDGEGNVHMTIMSKFSRKYEDNYSRVFASAKSKEIYDPDFVSRDKVSLNGRRPVDRNGNPVKVNGWSKNQIYSKARELREELRGAMLTKDECWDPSERNVQKMMRTEMSLKHRVKTQQYRRMMEVVSGNRTENNLERFRRGGRADA